MVKLLLSLIVGIGAGVIDLVPMLLRGAARNEAISAFVHWIAAGVLIAYSVMPVPSVLKGMIVTLVLTAPVLVRTAYERPASLVPIALMSVMLGGSMGVMLDRFAR
jgi:hypothetical protein